MKKNKLIFATLFGVLAIFMASCTADNLAEESTLCTCEEWGVCTCGDYCNCDCSVCNRIVDQDAVVSNTVAGFDLNILEVITNHLGSKAAVAQIQEDIKVIAELVPAEALAKLKAHPIHVVDDYYNTIRYADADDPDYPNSIVVGNIGFYNNFVTSNQPMYLLKTMAELYWDKYMTDVQKSAVTSAYNGIGSKYSSVYQFNGTKLLTQKVSSPAKDDLMSYFLELTEAYFDGNDYYPFDHAELERYDATGFAALTAAWGARTIPQNPYGVYLPPAGMTVGTNGNRTLNGEWYRKMTLADCNGYQYPIVGSRMVADSCFAQARIILEEMSKNKPGTTWMQQAMASNKAKGFYIIICAKGQSFSEAPEFLGNTSMDGAYGYGSTSGSPGLIIVESDICGPGIGGVKLGQSLLCHEFGHNIEDGLGEISGLGFTNTLVSLYGTNITNGGMWTGTGVYANSTYREYWAEATTAWYNVGPKAQPVNLGNGTTKAIVTHEDLREYDPAMYALMSIYYPLPTDINLRGFHWTW